MLCVYHGGQYPSERRKGVSHHQSESDWVSCSDARLTSKKEKEEVFPIVSSFGQHLLSYAMDIVILSLMDSSFFFTFCCIYILTLYIYILQSMVFLPYIPRGNHQITVSCSRVMFLQLSPTGPALNSGI